MRLVPLLDMWKLTADQANHSANMHYDELYVKGGLISRTTANLFLNLACNARTVGSLVVAQPFVVGRDSRTYFVLRQIHGSWPVHD